MAILVQLPNNASTSKYPKTFPHPLNLSHFYKDGDEFIDLALECYKKPKAEIFQILDDTIKELNTTDLPIIVNAGDFPPDAYYHEYYNHFFNGMTRSYITTGTYAKLFKEELADRYSNFSFVSDQPRYPRYDKIFYEDYPSVNGKIKASIRASWGCPRKCTMCPVPPYFDNKYIYFDPIYVANEIKKLYEEKGVRYFTFIDDNLSYHPDFVKLLLTLRRMKLKGVQYHCQEGFDIGTFDITRARLIKALKFDDVKIAFESIVSRTTELINKNSVNPKSIKRTLEAIKETDLKVKAFMLLGLDETEEEILENLKFFAKNKMTLRVNIIRDYPNTSIGKIEKSSKLDDKTLRGYKALAYASSFFIDTFNCDIFDTSPEDFVKDNPKYTFIDNELRGKTKFGFQTSRFEKGIKYIFSADIEENTGEKIVFKQPKPEDKEILGKGFTAGALKKSREIRREFLSKFGVEGKVPTSILIHDRKEYRYETIDLSAQRRGGNYVHHYRINRQKMHGRKDYTPGLEKTGFETQGRTDYISGFPQNVGRFLIDLYCPRNATIYDPFAGHNSRMQLCFKLGHNYIGVDCCKEFMEDNRAVRDMLYQRQTDQLFKTNSVTIELLEQSSESVPQIEDESCDFTITSPPYWDLEYYGPEEEQLGTGKKYPEFLEGIRRCIKENYRVLKPGSFCIWCINDFRKQKKFYPYHIDIYNLLIEAGFEGFNIYITWLGATVNHMFVQDIINHKILPKSHEYAIVVRKAGEDWWEKTK